MRFIENLARRVGIDPGASQERIHQLRIKESRQRVTVQTITVALGLEIPVDQNAREPLNPELRKKWRTLLRPKSLTQPLILFGR